MKIRFDLEIISRSRSVVVLLSFLFFPSLFLFHFEISSRGNPWTFRVRLFPAACIMHAPHPCTPQHSLLHLLLLPSQGGGCDTLFAAVGPRTSCSFHSWPTPLSSHEISCTLVNRILQILAPPLSALITIISIENFRAWSSDRGKVYVANLGWFNLLGLFFTRCLCIIFLFEKVILMVIKERWIMEGIVTRSNFGTVLIMDLLENKSYVRFLCVFFLIRSWFWKEKKFWKNFLQFKSNRIKKIFLEVKEF